jgi:hypothetical protein
MKQPYTMREKQMKQRLRVLLSLGLLVSLFASIPMLFAQEDDPESFQGQFFRAEPPQGWFGQSWMIEDEPDSELVIFTPSEVDYGTFNPSEDDIEDLSEISGLVDAIREGGALGIIIYNGDILAELGGDPSLLIGELISQLGLENSTQGTVEGRGLAGSSIQGTIPGGGALAGETFGFYGAIMRGQSITILLGGGAPESKFEEILPQFEHFAQTLEGSVGGEPVAFEATTAGFAGFNTPNYTIEIPEAWYSNYRVLEDDGYGLSILSPIEVTITDDEVSETLGDLEASEAFAAAISTDIMMGIMEFPRSDLDSCLTTEECANFITTLYKELLGDSLVEASELQSVTVGDEAGTEIIATLSGSGLTFTLRAVFVEHGDNLFLILAGGTEEQFTAQSDTIQQVLDSLTFK